MKKTCTSKYLVEQSIFAGVIYIEPCLVRKFSWVSAVRVQFNKRGSLVMVTGVLKQNIHKARVGEIIVIEARGEDRGEVTSRISLK